MANLARDRLRARNRQMARRQGTEPQADDHCLPLARVVQDEELRRLADALAALPYEQKEVIVLHVKGDPSFREIAGIQGVSINTIQSRYRYGIDKLRSMVNGQSQGGLALGLLPVVSSDGREVQSIISFHDGVNGFEIPSVSTEPGGIVLIRVKGMFPGLKDAEGRSDGGSGEVLIRVRVDIQ